MLALDFPEIQTSEIVNLPSPSLAVVNKVEAPSKPVNLNFACEFCGKKFRDTRDKRLHEESIHLKEKF